MGRDQKGHRMSADGMWSPVWFWEAGRPYNVTARDAHTVLEGKRSLYMPARALAAE